LEAQLKTASQRLARGLLGRAVWKELDVFFAKMALEIALQIGACLSESIQNDRVIVFSDREICYCRDDNVDSSRSVFGFATEGAKAEQAKETDCPPPENASTRFPARRRHPVEAMILSL
jgi:hypothetical protein